MLGSGFGFGSGLGFGFGAEAAVLLLPVVLAHGDGTPEELVEGPEALRGRLLGPWSSDIGNSRGVGIRSGWN